jgi:TonB family protein
MLSILSSDRRKRHLLSMLFLSSTVSLAMCQVVFGQQPTTSASAALEESSDRIKDRLVGPVRRVRVETAKLIYKDGSAQEGPRQPKSVTTYDVVGRRVDVTANPAEQQTASGKEEFRYDSRNNVVEMTLRGADGALLSKEVYEYEFDELGNWRKMIRSIAVYENGKVGLEPIEVTYRNITYYFDQSVAKLAPNTTPKTEALPKTQPAPKPEVTPAATDATKKSNVADASPSSETQPAIPTEVKESAPIIVQVSEDTLRSAVVELPQPEYPATLRNAGIGGKVEVQFLIDEKGEVATLRPISGNPLLTEATAIAWRKARFSAAKLSKQPARVTGVLSYEFTADPKRSKPTNAEREESSSDKRTPTEATTVKPEASAKPPKPNPSVTTTPPPVDPAAADKLRFATPFEKGLASLNSLQYQAAVDFFHQAIHANPNDALAYYKLGLAYSALGSHKETIVAYQQAITLARVFANADAYYRLGNAYSALNDHASAIEPLKQSLYMIRAQALENGKNQPGDPSETDVHFALGLAYYGTASYRNAVKEFKDAVKLNPNFASAHYGLGLAYLGYGDKRGAQKAEEALKKLKSPLANKLTDALLLPAVQKNKVF